MSPAVPLAVGWFSALLLAPLDGRRRGVRGLAVALAFALLGTLLALAADVARHGPRTVVTGGWPAEVGITLRADALGVLFAVASVALLAAVLAFEAARGPSTRTFPALTLLLGTGLAGLFLTGDVFNFYVFFELSMASGFALAGYGGARAEARAAVVFVLVNLVGSVLFLGAVAALYRLTGTLQMRAVAVAAAEAAPGAVLLVAALMLVAFGLKLGLFPFHYWLPVVYRDVRPAVAALFAGALANLASYGLLRFGGEVLPGTLAAGRPALLAMGAASVLYGSVQAVHRRELRDVLAYSSIAQVGYGILALGVGGAAGFLAATLYALVNSLHKTGLFLAASLGRAGGAWVLLAGLSMAGLPPSAGFVAKVAVFRAGAADGRVWLLTVLGVGSALSLVYVLQAWQHVFWGDPPPEGPVRAPTARGLVAALVLVVVALGFWPAPLVEWCGLAAAVLGGAP